MKHTKQFPDTQSDKKAFLFCNTQGSLRGFLAYVLDFDIVVSEFDLQSRHYVHFQTDTLEKGMNSLKPPPSY